MRCRPAGVSLRYELLLNLADVCLHSVNFPLQIRMAVTIDRYLTERSTLYLLTFCWSRIFVGPLHPDGVQPDRLEHTAGRDFQIAQNLEADSHWFHRGQIAALNWAIR